MVFIRRCANKRENKYERNTLLLYIMRLHQTECKHARFTVTISVSTEHSRSFQKVRNVTFSKGGMLSPL